MWLDILIGVAIFGYAIWTLVRLIHKSKKGKCAACELKKICAGSQCASDTMDKMALLKRSNLELNKDTVTK